MTYTEQLERETEQTRTQIAETLAELRASMTPAQVLHQIADRVGDGGGAAFVSNLKRQTINNPVPVALIGAGLAWLVLGGRASSGAVAESGSMTERLRNAASTVAETVRGAADATARTASQKTAEWTEAARQKGSEWTNAANETSTNWSDSAGSERQRWSDKAGDLADTAGAAADRARKSSAEAAEGARRMTESVRDSLGQGASDSYDAISGGARNTAAAMSQSARAAGERTRQASGALVDFCREQPLILAGLGLAVGAALGALLPHTESEDRLMGEASDQLKERAQDLASDQYDAAKDVGEQALATTEDETPKQPATDEQGGSSGTAIGEDTDRTSLVPEGEDQSQKHGFDAERAHP